MKQIHGGNIYKYKGFIDFSANINPLGMPKEIMKAAVDSAILWDRYPDPDCTELIKKIAEHERTYEENIAVGNGAADIIYRIVHALRPKKALICAPSFGEYKKALSETGCKINIHTLSEQNNFELSGDILDKMTGDTDIVFLCSPNNPTGRIIEKELLFEISKKCFENDIYLVCDECFLDFAKNGEDYSLRRCLKRKGIILKAFTKMFAVAGLRIGYAVCGDKETAMMVRNSGQFWSVSVPAQAAAEAALEMDDFVKKTVLYTECERGYLISFLKGQGYKVFDGAANFIMFKADSLFSKRMESKGILVRDLSSMEGAGEGFYRIAVRTHEENMIFTEALKCQDQ